MPKNLVILHLESIAWQALRAFPEAMPNLEQVMGTSRVYGAHFASATSTQMVLTYLCHGNDFELDGASELAPPAGNNPSVFRLLEDAGYRTAFLCVSAFSRPEMMPALAGSVPAIWATSDLGELAAKFDAESDAAPFAIYVWNLVSHVQHTIALAPYADGLDDVVGAACAVVDHTIGALIGILERKDLLDDTTLVILGDHGEDYWTHGFKKGRLHGVEPYSHVIHTPLVIRDARLPAGRDNRLASTIDIAPTCLDLVGLPRELPFALSGRSLLDESRRDGVFSQNFTASQPDASQMDTRKAFAISDRSNILMVSSRGLELFNHRLDPTNHTNLLHFFEIGRKGELVFTRPDERLHPHFATGMRHMLETDGTLNRDFQRLRAALSAHLQAKRDYIAARAPGQGDALDLSGINRISRFGRDRFFDRRGGGTWNPKRIGARAAALFSRRRPR